MGERLELGGERDADQLGGAQRVGAEQLAVGQHVVDQRRGIDDQIDGVGQPLPGLMIQAKVRFGLVASDDLQMLGGQFPVVPQQLWIAAVEGLVETPPRIFVGLGAHQTDQLAADEVHPFEPLQSQVTAEESGRAGQQDGPPYGPAPKWMSWRTSRVSSETRRPVWTANVSRV